MKLSRNLLINNVSYPIIDEVVILSLKTPGRAQFTINTKKQPVKKPAVVSFDLGYNMQSTLRRLFFGYIDEVVLVDDNRQKIFCREFSAGLNAPLPFSLRHVSLKDVLAEITQLTGLKFTVPDVAYANKKTANFYNLGNGYQAMDAIGRVFSVPNFIWQQQGHGQIYVGSLDDSRWADKPVTLPQNLFSQQTGNQSATLPAVPALRPGVTLNEQIITQLEFKKNQMTISWGAND